VGCECEILKGDWWRAVNPAELATRLKADRKGEIKAVLAVQIDTASGVVNDIAALGAAIKDARHDALLMVDAVASLGCVPFEMDAWGVDVAVAGSQKGLMTPPGLSFTAVGPRARAMHERAGLRTPYWNWAARESHEHYSKYGGTPPEHSLFGLRQALDMLFAEGLESAWRRHRLLGEAVRRAVAAWSKGGAIDFNIREPGERSDTVTVALVDDPAALLDYCDRKCGVVLGRTIGALAGKGFRIAHMGHINAPMVLGTLGVIEMGLRALRIPHNPGTEAAIAWLGDQVTAGTSAG
jgi:alanine-glyoxylate transaminase / serine-glyoxylate transaminase / serine-pyruvate transaminase